MKVKITGIVLLISGLLFGLLEIPNHLYSELIVKADISNTIVFLLIVALIMSGIIILGLNEEILERQEPTKSQFI